MLHYIVAVDISMQDLNYWMRLMDLLGELGLFLLPNFSSQQSNGPLESNENEYQPALNEYALSNYTYLLDLG